MHAQSRLLLAVVLTFVTGLAIPAPARADRAARMVTAWYQRYLDRFPNDAGARDWVDQLRRGRDPLLVEAGILSSDEYWRRAGSNPIGWVDRLFRDTTGRPPSPWELRFWTDRARFADRERIAVEFLLKLHGDRPWNW
jgi:hypothetical protein